MVCHENSTKKVKGPCTPGGVEKLSLVHGPSEFALVSSSFLVTTSKALVTSSDALVSNSFLLLLVRHLFLVAWHLLQDGSR